MIPDKTFSRPIPGESLTKEPGTYPWDRPPQYADNDEAAYAVFAEITRPEKLAQIFYFLENGVSIAEMTKIILYAGAGQGIYSIHSAYNLAQPVATMLTALAAKAGIKYEIEKKKISKLAKMMAANDIDKRMPELTAKAEEAIEESPVPTQAPATPPAMFTRPEAE